MIHGFFLPAEISPGLVLLRGTAANLQSISKSLPVQSL
jgi:hypothetical protein